MDKNDFDKYIQLKAEFEKKVLEIVGIMAKTENKRFNIDELESIEIEGGNIAIYFEEYDNGCGTDYYRYIFPENYLYSDDWVTEYNEKVKKSQEEKVEFEKQREIQAQKIKEAYELKMLRELREKYGE